MTGNVLTILTDDNPLLHQVSEPVTEFDEKLHSLIGDMVETMIQNNGVGLSAVQVGILSRIILVREELPGSVMRIHPMINPVFLRKGNRMVTTYEGCLSINCSKWRDVTRSAKCEIEYQDPLGNKLTMNMSGRTAIISQHEIDHLDGILITDKPAA